MAGERLLSKSRRAAMGPIPPGNAAFIDLFAKLLLA
jgi:hypothetical protein